MTMWKASLLCHNQWFVASFCSPGEEDARSRHADGFCIDLKAVILLMWDGEDVVFMRTGWFVTTTITPGLVNYCEWARSVGQVIEHAPHFPDKRWGIVTDFESFSVRQNCILYVTHGKWRVHWSSGLSVCRQTGTDRVLFPAASNQKC